MRYWILVLVCCSFAHGADDAIKRELEQQKPIWYDAPKDSWQRVEAKAPEEPTYSNNSGISISGGGVIGWLLICVLIIVVALVIWTLLRNLEFDRSPISEEKRHVAQVKAKLSALSFVDETDVDPFEALQRAIKAEDWRRAMAWSFALHLLTLERLGAISLAPGITNRGYQRALKGYIDEHRDASALMTILRDAVRVFERIWFGHDIADRSEVSAMEDSRLRLQNLAKAAAERRP